MALADFTEKVLAQFSKSITDKVFVEIQNDHELMYEYLKLVEAHGLTVVNQQIGRKVKTRYQLTNDQSRQEAPRSTLIQSHQEFE
jgi:hypothetical protein